MWFQSLKQSSSQNLMEFGWYFEVAQAMWDFSFFVKFVKFVIETLNSIISYVI